MLEQEVKVLLNETEFARLALLSKSRAGKQVIQTNHYFDTADFWFDKQAITIRIREKGDDYTITIKVTDLQNTNSKIKTSQEFNYPLDYQMFAKLIQSETGLNTHDFQFAPEINLYQEQLARIKYLGKLVTERTKFRPADNLPYVELDKNYYLDKVDWELECEISGTDELSQIETWLTANGIDIVLSKRGKNGRFIEYLKFLKK